MLLALALAGALGIFFYSAAQTLKADGHSATRSFNPNPVAPGAEVSISIDLNNVGRLGRVTETLPAGFTYVSSNLDADEVVTNGQQIRFRLLGSPDINYTVTAPIAPGSYNFSGTVVNEDGNSRAVTGDVTLTVQAPQPDPTPDPNEPTPDPVELSTYDAGAENVRVTIRANAGRKITGGLDIKVTLPGFGIPSTIDDSDVILDGDDSYYGNPADVSVSDDTITITLPTRIAGTSERAELSGDYKIIFKSSAGLSNPAYAKPEGVKLTVSDADPKADDEDPTTDPIVAKATVKPTFVTRSGDATVTAKGLRDGTTTVYLVDGDGNRGAALGTGTADDGVVAIEIDTSGSALVADATTDGDSDTGVNTLRVIDSNNGEVGKDFMLGIKPTVKLGSETAKRSTSLEISVSDWYYGTINQVTVGGVSVGTINVSVPSDKTKADYGKETFEVIIPDKVRTGSHDVVVTGANPMSLKAHSAKATVNIGVIALNVSPSTVVPGQRVTITGSGFANSEKVTGITIGGVPFNDKEPNKIPEDANSTSSGRVAVTVAVPLTVGAGNKTVELTVTDDNNTSDTTEDDQSRSGEGTITVSKPSITLTPSESVPGSVISVTGSGFNASGRFEVLYDGKVETVGQADGSGNFSVRLTVPSSAGVGATNPVKVQSRGNDKINAKADHKTPGSMITLPDQAQEGTLMTITGSNFEPFTALKVMIGVNDATPSAAETDKNGAFELQARVPRLGAGSHTVTVQDKSPRQNSATETFEVVTTPIVSTPQEVFRSLGDNLVVVWRYDNATATWASYSPGAPAELNDLTGVSRGDIVWIQVNESVDDFQGNPLSAGWNLISLE